MSGTTPENLKSLSLKTWLWAASKTVTFLLGRPVLYILLHIHMSVYVVYIYRASKKKKVTVLEAAHSHVFSDRHFKFSGVVPDIIRFCYMTLFLISDVWSLSCILSNENAKIQKVIQIVWIDANLRCFLYQVVGMIWWYFIVQSKPIFFALLLLP